MLSKAYLIFYNFAMTVGWSYVMYLAYEKRNEHENMWKHVEVPLKIFQSGALLEVVHAATGIVKANALLTFFQVLSRVFVVWCVLEICPPSAICIGFPLCMLAWGITEIIRYGYYFLSLVGLSQLLAWFRYTLFIVLYPIGITGELICMYQSLAYIKQTSLWTYQMPNALNFVFNYYYIVILAMLAYIPIFPQLYFHMFAQRKKVLGGGKKPHRD